MQRIVSNGLKIDLHIHSCFSSNKDKAKVRNNTLANLPILVEKLDSNGVNLCSITDHDVFSYEMYSTLKKNEEEDNTIKKVLPGVEFSVCFEFEGKESIIHIVTIFSDENDDKVQKIEKLIRDNPPTYKQAYRENDFLFLLRKININTILIAHQKNSLTSKKTRKHDANTLGETKFLEFVYTDYFEAFEFKNRRNEVLNKNFLLQHDYTEEIRFVTGTDCHDWTVYPSETPSEIIDHFPYTFAKCLPTFKGLVMAITDHSRLKMVDSFFTATKYTLPSIKILNSKQEIEIPLSKGINAIVGDNSIGKSLLLHEITGYTKLNGQLPKTVKNGYKKYLQRYSIKIPKQISSEQLFCFDMQGEVRRKFEEKTLNATDFLGQYFPRPIDSSKYNTVIENEIKRIIEYLRKKFDYDRKIKELASFMIEVSQDDAESLTFVNNVGRAKHKTDKLQDITIQYDNVDIQLVSLIQLGLDAEDIRYINEVRSKLISMRTKYNDRLETIKSENGRIDVVSDVMRKIIEHHSHSISDMQKRKSSFSEHTISLKNQISDLIRDERSIETYSTDESSITIDATSNKVFDYEFVSKLNIEVINSDYLKSLITRVLRTGKTINWETITEKELQDSLLKYDNSSVLQFLENAMKQLVKEDLRQINSIICQGMDKYAELSSGLDAKIYFDLLSYESQKDGIYIIDQPEDNISQSAIRDYLLDRFKTMGENRQVIMVTHNPQFIVNLDVDNIIFISQKNGELLLQSGALEYTCDDYNVIDIVAKNIDGGLDSLKKRLKRYEKTSEL